MISSICQGLLHDCRQRERECIIEWSSGVGRTVLFNLSDRLYYCSNIQWEDKNDPLKHVRRLYDLKLELSCQKKLFKTSNKLKDRPHVQFKRVCEGLNNGFASTQIIKANVLPLCSYKPSDICLNFEMILSIPSATTG